LGRLGKRGFEELGGNTILLLLGAGARIVELTIKREKRSLFQRKRHWEKKDRARRRQSGMIRFALLAPVLELVGGCPG